MTRYKYLGNFSNNQFSEAKNASSTFISRSPADLDDELAEIAYDDSGIEDIISSAIIAQRKWAKESVATRVDHIDRLPVT